MYTHLILVSDLALQVSPHSNVAKETERMRSQIEIIDLEKYTPSEKAVIFTLSDDCRRDFFENFLCIRRVT